MTGTFGGALEARKIGAEHLTSVARGEIELEENVLVSGKGPVVFTMMEHMEEAMKR